MGFTNDFGISGMNFNVESVMASIHDEAPTEHIEFTPLEGEMVGLKFIIGEFKLTDKTYDNGDGEVTFNTSFLDKTDAENTELMEKYIEEIKTIAHVLIKNAFDSAIENKKYES
jgi:hypothetical protein